MKSIRSIAKFGSLVSPGLISWIAVGLLRQKRQKRQPHSKTLARILRQHLRRRREAA